MNTFKVVTIGLAISLASSAFAQSTIVQWGAPDGETDIVTSNVPANGGLNPPNFPTTTFTPNSDNNPMVGAGYYPNATGRTPIFSAAGAHDGDNFLWQRQVQDNANNGDRISLAHRSTAPDGGAMSMQAMIVWEDENWLATTDDTLDVMSVEAFRFNIPNDGSVTGEARFVIENGNGWFASQTLGLNGGFNLQEYAVAAIDWFDFTPITAGTSTIGAMATPSFTGVESVGYYYESESPAQGNLGAFIRYFRATMTSGSTGGLGCDADADGDCEIDDLNALYAAAGTAGAFDLDGNGTVGPEDVAPWLAAASTNANLANPTGQTYGDGDLNLDFNVDSTDLGLLLNNFGAMNASAGAGPGWGGGDITMEGNVDSTDLGRLLNNFGFMGAAAAAVPEPAPLSLLLVAAIGLLSFSRRRQSSR